MFLNSLRLRLAPFFLALLVVACGGGRGSSAPPPADFAVAEGNGQVTVTWTATPGVEYWLMYAQTSAPINLKSPPGVHYWLNNVSSPLVVTGLTNGLPWSFAMDARTNGGPGGAQTASVTATPRLGGTVWTAGSGLVGSTDFKGVAYGQASDASLDYIAVGSGSAIYKSTDGAAWTDAQPTWVDSAGAGLETSPTVDFNAATYTLGKFIAVGANSTNTHVFHSTDLKTWTASITAVTSNLHAVASDGATVVAVGDGGKLWWSTDGATWAEGTYSGTSVTSSLYGVSYLGSSVWAAVGANCTLLLSGDGRTWVASTASLPLAQSSVTLRAIAAIGSTWVVVGDAGAIMTSADSGSTWVNHSVDAVQNFYAVNASVTTLASLPQFLAVGASGIAYTSADGGAWTRQTTGGQTLYGLWGSATQYIAVGAAGTSFTSK